MARYAKDVRYSVGLNSTLFGMKRVWRDQVLDDVIGKIGALVNPYRGERRITYGRAVVEIIDIVRSLKDKRDE